MTQATKPYRYAGFVLTPRADGAQDLIDPATGRWATFATQRHARWTASVVTNFMHRLDAHTPLPAQSVPTPVEEVRPHATAAKVQ